MIEYSPVQKEATIKLDRDVGSINKQFLSRLIEIEEEINRRACQEIRFSQPILSLDEIGIIYPNTLTVIQGQKGVHKSRLTEEVCAAFLCSDPNRNFIGFVAAPLKRYHVVYVDTERNQNDQFPFAIQRIKERAGFEKTTRPKNLQAASLLEFDRSDRYAVISEYLDWIHDQHQNEHLIVVLDVITDCNGSFNDAKDSLQLVDHLNKMINRCNVSFICVIHENPNSFGESKARGHLGTELINKASTVISIGYEKAADGKNTDLIVLKFLHTRNTKRPEPHYLRYSDEAKGLVVADPNFVAEQKNRKAEKASISDLKEWFLQNLPSGEISRSELMPQLIEYFGCTDRTLGDRLKSLADNLPPFLSNIKKGKEVYYSLAKPEGSVGLDRIEIHF